MRWRYFELVHSAVRAAIVVVVAAAALAPLCPAADKNPFERAIDPFAGLFVNDDYQVKIDIDVTPDGNCRGTFRVGDNDYAFTSTRQGDTINGSYQADGKEHAFTAMLSGDTLSFTSGTASLKLLRQKRPPAPPAPLTPPNPPGPAQPPSAGRTQSSPKPSGVNIGEILGTPPYGLASGATPADQWAFTATAGGLRFRYPKAWKVVDGRPGLALVPDDAERDLQGRPMESVLVSVPSQAQAATPAQQVVPPIAFIEQKYPFVKLIGEPAETLCLAGAGRTLIYEGAIADGNVLRVVIYENRVGDDDRYLLHLGRKDLVERRQPVSRQVFQSFGWEEGRSDPKLLGEWRQQRSRAGLGLPSPTAAALAAAGQALPYSLHLTPDGQCRRAAAAATDPSAAPRQDPPTDRTGTWIAMNNRIALAWADGTLEMFAYRIDANPDGRTRLTLEAPGAPGGDGSSGGAEGDGLTFIR